MPIVSHHRVVTPDTLAEALEFLAEHAAEGWQPLAGGTDIMVSVNHGQEARTKWLDLSRIRGELARIEPEDGRIRIGGLATMTALRQSKLCREACPLIGEAAATVGAIQIQNRATLGGNIANASPAGDSLPVLLVLDASVVAVSIDGERQIPYTGFHLGYRRTALEPGELIGRVLLPIPAPGSVQAFRKVGTREAQAISKVVVSMLGRVDGREIVDYRLAAGSVAPTPVRLSTVEDSIRGREVGMETASDAGRLARAAVKPIDDVRSTASRAGRPRRLAKS